MSGIKKLKTELKRRITNRRRYLIQFGGDSEQYQTARDNETMQRGRVDGYAQGVGDEKKHCNTKKEKFLLMANKHLELADGCKEKPEDEYHKGYYAGDVDTAKMFLDFFKEAFKR